MRSILSPSTRMCSAQTFFDGKQSSSSSHTFNSAHLPPIPPLLMAKRSVLEPHQLRDRAPNPNQPPQRFRNCCTLLVTSQLSRLFILNCANSTLSVVRLNRRRRRLPPPLKRKTMPTRTSLISSVELPKMISRMLWPTFENVNFFTERTLFWPSL